MAESAVVGYPHEIKGEGVYAYVILKRSAEDEDHDKLSADLQRLVKDKISGFAVPEYIQVRPDCQCWSESPGVPWGWYNFIPKFLSSLGGGTFISGVYTELWSVFGSRVVNRYPNCHFNVFEIAFSP